MGAILDLVETLKEPKGIIGLIIICAAIYFLLKWVFAPHPDDEE